MNKTKHSAAVVRALAGAALAASIALTSGCFLVAAGAAGAGTVAYVRGELDSPIDAGYDSTIRAADRAIEQLQFAKVGETKDGISDTIKARTGGDKKVEIIVTRIGDSLSKVQIRIGFFGDEFISRTILDKIKADL
jgi:hypothetical protein